MPKATSRPRRCRRCPDFPLLSQCIHSAAGRKYLSGQQEEAASEDSNSDNAPLSQDPGASATQPPSFDPSAPFTNVGALPMPNCSTMPNNMLPPPVPVNNTPPPVPMNNLPPPPPDTQSVPVNPVPQQHPIPLTAAGQDTPAVSQDDTTFWQALDPRLRDCDTTTPQTVNADEAEDYTPGTPRSSKRRRATVKDAPYGVIEGVRRGNTKIQIPRQRPLPRPAKDASSSTKRFNRVMQDLLIRCERLSAETGCWLYISAQHVNANMGFYNYTSPRVRLEAKAPITALLDLSLKMYTSLLSARRTDAVALNMQFEECKEELRRVEQELAEKKARLSEVESRLLNQSN